MRDLNDFIQASREITNKADRLKLEPMSVKFMKVEEIESKIIRDSISIADTHFINNNGLELLMVVFKNFIGFSFQ